MKRALCLGVRDVLRAGLGLKDTECEFMPDGKPPPSWGGAQGRPFVAVHRGGMQSSDRNSLDRTFGATVTLTLRLNVARDRAGPSAAFRLAEDGLEDWCERVILLLHMNEDVREAANNALEVIRRAVSADGNWYGFSTPVGFEGDGGEASEVGPDWFGAGNHSERANIAAAAGLTQTLSFGGAQRVQPVETLRNRGGV